MAPSLAFTVSVAVPAMKFLVTAPVVTETAVAGVKLAVGSVTRMSNVLPVRIAN